MIKNFFAYYNKILCLSLMLIVPSYAASLYPFDDPKQAAQFQHLIHDVRCLVCQNQDLADSHAELAKDLRGEIYQLVRDGNSDHEITEYLTARYGDFILFNPPLKMITMLLWFGPLLFLGLGLVVFWNTCIKRKSMGQ